MAKGLASACTAHPGFESIGRCKQCSKPFCSKCQTKGPTGIFCSETCKETHEQFVQRAQQYDNMRKDSTTFASMMILLRKIVFGAFAVIIIGVILHYAGVEIPVLSSLIRSVTGG